MSEGKRGKKRPKSYYKKCAGGKRTKGMNELDSGMKGFLVTCNKYEKETVREMYNLLNEYADKLYGPEQVQKPEAEAVSDDDEDDDDIEKALAKERLQLVSQTKTERRFQNTDTKFKNLIFIRTMLEEPCALAHQIFTEMVKTQTKKARYAQRMIPVSVVCKAQAKTIEDTMKTVLEPHFSTPFGVGIKYTNLCKIRNNQSISRAAILPMINRRILEMNPLHKLCHDEPELVVIVEVIRNLCCIGVVKDYFKFKKYNFHEIIQQATDSTEHDCENKDAEKEEETSVVDQEHENVNNIDVDTSNTQLQDNEKEADDKDKSSEDGKKEIECVSDKITAENDVEKCQSEEKMGDSIKDSVTDENNAKNIVMEEKRDKGNAVDENNEKDSAGDECCERENMSESITDTKSSTEVVEKAVSSDAAQ